MQKLLEEHLTKDWVEKLGPFLFSPENEKLFKQIAWLYKNREVEPEVKDVFRIFRLIKPQDVKVVIMGMDPYQRPNEATGVAMGVEKVDYLPPTLQIMFEEIERDIGYTPTDCSLINWVEQGVMMLNAALTVERGKSGSHIDMWKPFTRNLLMELSKDSGKIYVFMGKRAQYYARYVECFLNDIIATPHPVADAYANRHIFYGCGIFSKINKLLPNDISW